MGREGEGRRDGRAEASTRPAVFGSSIDPAWYPNFSIGRRGCDRDVFYCGNNLTEI